MILYNFKLREGWFEALFNIRGALDTVMDGAHGAVSVFSLDGVIDQDSEQFQQFSSFSWPKDNMK